MIVKLSFSYFLEFIFIKWRGWQTFCNWNKTKKNQFYIRVVWTLIEPEEIRNAKLNKNKKTIDPFNCNQCKFFFFIFFFGQKTQTLDEQESFSLSLEMIKSTKLIFNTQRLILSPLLPMNCRFNQKSSIITHFLKVFDVFIWSKTLFEQNKSIVTRF